MMGMEQSQPKFKDAKLGLIPEDWETVRLSEIFDTQQGKAMSAKARSGSSHFPFLRTINVLWGRLELTTLDHMDFVRDEQEKLRLQAGDLLLCEGGEVGRTAIWKGEISMCYYQNHIHRLRKRVSDIWPEFYMYWMQAAFLLFGLYRGEAIKTTIPNLSQGRLQSFILPKPTLPEQKRIAFILSKIQQAIEEQGKAIDATKSLKRSLMQKLFTEGIGYDEFRDSEIGQIPKQWNLVELSKNARFQYGYTATAIGNSKGSKFLRITDIGPDGRIDWSKVPNCEIGATELQKYRLKSGDVLVARIGATTGKSSLVTDVHDAVFGSYLIRILVDRDRIIPDFLFYFTQTSEYWHQINANKGGKLKKGVSASWLGTLLLPLPTLDEQKALVNILRALDNKTFVEEKKRAVLENLFKTMLSKLMTGEVRVNDLDLGAKVAS